MGIDISKQLTKCEKCNHARWTTDTSPCKGCFPAKTDYPQIRVPLTDSEIEEIRQKNLALTRLARRKPDQSYRKREIGVPRSDFEAWVKQSKRRLGY